VQIVEDAQAAVQPGQRLAGHAHGLVRRVGIGRRVPGDEQPALDAPPLVGIGTHCRKQLVETLVVLHDLHDGGHEALR